MSTSELLDRQYQAFLAAPPLLKISGFELLETTDLNVDQLTSSPPQTVFGKRMEFFFSQYLQTSDRYELLAENIQIIKEGVTLGELDFLVFDNLLKESTHIEMACKFYLMKPRDAHPCVGPNHKDWLHLKLQKLKERQFPLLFQPATKTTLLKLGITAENLKQKLHLTGFLFLPYETPETPLPENINPKAVAGHWIASEHFQKAKFKDHLFSIVPKENWLLNPEMNEEWSSFTTIQEIIQPLLVKQRSPMLWVKNPDNSRARVFVVWLQ